MVIRPVSRNPHRPSYSLLQGAAEAFGRLASASAGELPTSFFQKDNKSVVFVSHTPDGQGSHLPCPVKQQDAVAAVKALEGCAAASIADLRYGREHRLVEVDVERTLCFLMSAYLVTVDGRDKADPRVESVVPDTDLNQAQSVLYRRLSAGLYATKEAGRYYHIHGSLDASRTLEMIGLPSSQPHVTTYKDCIQTIETAVSRFTVSELEHRNQYYRQAGIPALRWDEFRNTRHGRALIQLPPLTVRALDTSTPPVPFAQQTTAPAEALQGIRVLELCRIIAGPTIGKLLASHGASVLKVTSNDTLPDVPFFQADVNTGKHTASLDLHKARDRAIFDGLLAEADVLIDGYRPGALARLGYGSAQLARLGRERGRGYVYVAEDCFGGTGMADPAEVEWADRPGWQQIADCVTGVAWIQGQFMCPDRPEPIVPPFPVCDYGTGALGCVAAMAGLYRRATVGGSWECRTSLCQYDVFALSLGLLPVREQERLRRTHDEAFFQLRHNDSVDEVGRRALRSMRRLSPHVFSRNLMQSGWGPGFGRGSARVRWPKEPMTISGLRVGYRRGPRPNGHDLPSWTDWEDDPEVVNT